MPMTLRRCRRHTQALRAAAADMGVDADDGDRLLHFSPMPRILTASNTRLRITRCHVSRRMSGSPYGERNYLRTTTMC